MNVEKEKIRKYLLGLLEHGDLEAVDVRIIEDDDFSNEVRFVESELVEEFLEGNLSGEELKLFNANFLISKKRDDLVWETVALKKAAARIKSSIESEAVRTERASKSVFGFWRPLLAFAAVTAIVVIAVLFWRSQLGETQLPIEIEYAKLNASDLTDTGQFPLDSTFSLISSNLRDGTSPISKIQEQLKSDVLFRLALPSGESPEKLYSISIFRASKPVFGQRDLKSYANQGGRDLRIIVPSSVLEKGQYQVKVVGIGDKAEVGTFNFGIF